MWSKACALQPGNPSREPLGKQAGEGTELLGAGNLTPREIQSFPSYSGKEGDPSIIERRPKQKGEAKAKKEKAISSTQEKEQERQGYKGGEMIQPSGQSVMTE